MTSRIPLYVPENPILTSRNSADFIDTQNPKVMSDLYKKAVQSLRETYPLTKKMLGPVEEMSHGWSARSSVIGYGLTYEGISEWMGLKKMKSTVLLNPTEIVDKMLSLPLKGSFACVIDSNTFGNKRSERSHHALSLFVRSTPIGKFQLFFNDSLGKPPKVDFFQNIRSDIACMIYGSRLVRQINDLSCQTFATNDCAAFENDPELINKILFINAESMTQDTQGIYQISKLPSEMLSLSSSPLRHTIDDQITLLKHHIREQKSLSENTLYPVCPNRKTNKTPTFIDKLKHSTYK